jgi:DNA mismatch endonuclease (patch repair protein)
MTDRITKGERSRNMSRIRSFGNESTEKRMIRLFRQNGIKGWRRHLKLPGRPDFTFPEKRVIVFVDGCFWHSCPVCNWRPATNVSYWQGKLARNRQMDRSANTELRKAGWKVVRIWEHVLKRQPNNVISRIRVALGQS